METFWRRGVDIATTVEAELKMAEQRAYAALVTTVDRKAKELLSYIDKEDINTRIVKSKHDKLLSDLAEVKKLGVAYISTLTAQATIDKIYDEQGELFERVNKALEGACETMELEEFKVALLEKAQVVEMHCKTVSNKVTSFQKRVENLNTRKSGLSKGSYDILINELDALESLVCAKSDDIKYLVVNDSGSKSKYEAYQSQLDDHLEPLLDLKLRLTSIYEDQTEIKSNVVSSGSQVQGFSENLKPQPTAEISSGANYQQVSETNLSFSSVANSLDNKMLSEPSSTAGLSLGHSTSSSYGTAQLSQIGQISVPRSLPVLPGSGYCSSGQGVIMAPGGVQTSPNYGQAIQAPSQQVYRGQVQSTNAGYNYPYGPNVTQPLSAFYGALPQSVGQGVGGMHHAASPYYNFGAPPTGVGCLPKIQIQKIKPPVFDGDIGTYPAWKKRWKELISPGSGSECEELYRMQDAMGPKNLAATIKSFQSLREAWNYLDDQYGRADVAAIKLIRDFKNLDLGKSSPHEQFMELFRQFRVLATHLNEIGQLRALDSLTEVSMIINKLPGDIKTKYAEFKSSHGYLVGYALISTFMEQQSLISRECCVTLNSTSVKADGKANIKCYTCNGTGHYSKDCPNKKSVDGIPKNLLKINGLSSKSLSCGLCNSPHKVEDGKNKGKFKTRLASCDMFRGMSVNERAQTLSDLGGCTKCTDWQHKSKDCDAMYGKKQWRPCTISDGNGSNKCGGNHHNLLHGSNHAYVCTMKSGSLKPLIQSAGEPLIGHCGQTFKSEESLEVLLLMQKIPVLCGPNKTVDGLIFFDNGATLGLIREQFAVKLRLAGRNVKRLVQIVGQDWSVWETIEYAVTLVDQKGARHLVKVFSIESITSPMDYVRLDGIIYKFPDTRLSSINRPEGPVDLLIGLDRSSLHPKAACSVGDLTLYESLFGTGWVLGGSDPALKQSSVVFNSKANKLRHAIFAEDYGLKNSHAVNFIKSYEKPVATFIESEQMGTVQPRRCNNCLGCTTCSNQAMALSRKEFAELRLIQDSVHIDKDSQKVIVSYPAIKDFSILSDNREQALSRARSLEKRLLKSGFKESYDEQLKDFIDRKAVERITDEELQSYKGPVNYVDHHGVLSDSNTTPYRFVVNSSLSNNNSGISLNDCIPKGPNSLRSLFQCIITFRSYTHVVVFDLSKAYQSMYTGEQEKHLRRIVWRFNPTDPWETYGFLRVTYGDRIAACALEVAKGLIFELGKSVDHETAVKMGYSDYVDDCNVGADSQEEIDAYIGEVMKDGNNFRYTGTVSQILGLVGWSAKVMVRDGENDPDAIAKIKEKYLGLSWDPAADVIKYRLKVNLVPKVRKVRPGNAPDITLENIDLLKNSPLTLNVVASVVYSWYDPPGLLCPIILKYKLLLSDTIESGVKWKEVLPDSFQIRWKEALEQAIAFGEISFARSIKPEGVVGNPSLVGYSDGSKVAYAAVVYIRWRLSNPDSKVVPDKFGDTHQITHVSRLIAAKAKVSKIESIPRNEINGLVMLARLVTAILPGLVDKPIEFLPIIDSRCTIQSVEAEAKVLKDFFNNRCEEWDEHKRDWISQGLSVESLFYTASEDNISDLATRGKVIKSQIDELSEWQNGPSYLSYERDSSWPINREMLHGEDHIPDTERLVRIFSLSSKDPLASAPNLFLVIRWVTERHRNLPKVLRIISRFLVASRSRNRSLIEVEPAPELLTQSRHLLEIVYGQDTAVVVRSGRLVGLDPVLSRGRYVTRGRFGKGIASILGIIELPILLRDSYLAYLIMVNAHEETHSAAKSTLARSRSQAWIVRGLSLAVRVCNECFQCKLFHKVTSDQKMGYLPLERFEVGLPPFSNVSLDLAAPLKVLDMVKGRISMKVWPLIICCLNTGAVHLELLHTYGAEAFLLRWKVFCCIRGVPKLVISDMGSQLQAASHHVEWSGNECPTNWKWESIQHATSVKGTVWKFVPAGCQWQNGLAESRIKIFKQTFAKCIVSTINGNKSLVNYAEMQSLLADMMNRMNDRPIGLKTLTDHDLVPLTPNCLLLGRTSTSVASIGDDDLSTEDYPKRLRYCNELQQFWCREFEKQVFYNLLPYQRYKDTNRYKNLCVGDVCLLSYPGKVQDISRYCRIDQVHPDEDGVIRNVTVSLRSRDAREKLLLYRSKKPMQMLVGVKRLVLICPNEELKNNLESCSVVPQLSLAGVGEHSSGQSVVTVTVKVVLDAEPILDIV